MLGGKPGTRIHGEPKKTKLELDQERTDFVHETGHWLDLFERLGCEGNEDARRLTNEIKEMMTNQQDKTEVWRHFLGGLLRYAVVQSYERPVTPTSSANFAMRMPVELLEKIDTAVAAGSAANRSEFVRSLLNLAFSVVDVDDMTYTTATLKFVRMLNEHPEQIVLFYLIRALFGRDNMGVSKTLLTLAGPLSEIVAAIGGEGVERVRERFDKLLEGTRTADWKPKESEDGAGEPE